MKTILLVAKRRHIKWALPWVATAVTALAYSDSRSHFLDRLVVFMEGSPGGF